MTALAYPDPPLTDGRIRLRPWSEGDVPAIVGACRDPLMPRFLTDLPSPYDDADARDWIARHEPARLAGQDLDMAIVDQDDQVLGAIGVSLSRRGSANVGYWLAPDARGQGYASAALRLWCDWLFSTLEVERIELTTAPENVASQRVATACGFRPEGYLRRNLRYLSSGTRRDSVLFGLLADEFNATAGPSPQVVWLNGTFGAGKTSAASELKRRRPELLVFDPEYIGFVLRECVPVPTGDFQDLPEWREVVAATVLSLARHQPGPVLAPMSMLRQDYLSQVFIALRAGGIAVTHVLLDAPDQVLSARIAADTEVPDSAGRFRREKLDVYRGARDWLRVSADLVIDSGELSITKVADRIEALIDSPAGATKGRAGPGTSARTHPRPA